MIAASCLPSFWSSLPWSKLRVRCVQCCWVRVAFQPSGSSGLFFVRSGRVLDREACSVLGGLLQFVASMCLQLNHAEP